MSGPGVWEGLGGLGFDSCFLRSPKRHFFLLLGSFLVTFRYLLPRFLSQFQVFLYIAEFATPLTRKRHFCSSGELRCLTFLGFLPNLSFFAYFFVIFGDSGHILG